MLTIAGGIILAFLGMIVMGAAIVFWPFTLLFLMLLIIAALVNK